MTDKTVPDANDWQPEVYERYFQERIRPAYDLAMSINMPEAGTILDVGCGTGSGTAFLRQRWPDAAIIGVDNSPNMLKRASESDATVTWLQRDITGTMADLGHFDVVFSNSVLQWLPDIPDMIHRLYDLVRPGGVLAIQVPDMSAQPRQKALESLLGSDSWRKQLASITTSVHRPYPYYYEILSGLTGKLHLWQTEYIHIMKDAMDIAEWYTGSGLRPFLQALPDDVQRKSFFEEFTELLRKVYPLQPDGKVLFPFKRIFFLLYKTP